MFYLGKENNLISDIRFPNIRTDVLNIHYVDDTLLFPSPSDECFINLKRILCCFQVYFGLKINFCKSSLTGIGISDVLSERYSSMIGCVQTPFPITYLRISFNFKKATHNDWAIVLIILMLDWTIGRADIFLLGTRSHYST